MKKIIKGTNGKDKCIYDLPDNIETAEQMDALIYGYNINAKQCKELQGQPKLLGLNGPMLNGFAMAKETGEVVPVIRYEKPVK